MKIKKGQKLTVIDSRKGTYNGVAKEDFDTDDEWYSVAVDQDESICGLNNEWFKGDSIPCRNGLATIKKRKE